MNHRTRIHRYRGLCPVIIADRFGGGIRICGGGSVRSHRETAIRIFVGPVLVSHISHARLYRLEPKRLYMYSRRRTRAKTVLSENTKTRRFPTRGGINAARGVGSAIAHKRFICNKIRATHPCLARTPRWLSECRRVDPRRSACFLRNNPSDGALHEIPVAEGVHVKRKHFSVLNITEPFRIFSVFDPV